MNALPSSDTIAKYSHKPITATAKIASSDAAYYHSRYLVRRDRNYAIGLNSAGQPIKNPNRKTFPQLKGLTGADYKREYEKLNPRKGR